MEQLLCWNNKYLLHSVDNEIYTDLNEEHLEDEPLEFPPFPFSSPSPSLSDSPSPTSMNNEDIIPI